MILSQLPAPTKEHAAKPTPIRSGKVDTRVMNVGTATKEPPPYGSAERSAYRPRKQEDFGDGGQTLIFTSWMLAFSWFDVELMAKQRVCPWWLDLINSDTYSSWKVVISHRILPFKHSNCEPRSHISRFQYLNQASFAGAFPEVRQAQFPLGMGKSDNKSSGTLNASVGGDGSIDYGSILTQSKRADKNVVSEHGALVPKIDDINKGVSHLY